MARAFWRKPRFRAGLVQGVIVVASEPISIGSETTQPLTCTGQLVFECPYGPCLRLEDLRTAEKIKPWVSAD